MQCKMIEVVNNIITLIGLFLCIMWLPLHTQCSRPTGRTLCANVSNVNKTWFKERRNENNFIYYAESGIIENEPLLNDMDHNTTVYFCIDVVMLTKVIQIANKTNIALYGLSGSHTEVHCRGNKSGYRFTNYTNITLSNISFINCGSLNLATVHYTKGTTPCLSAVWFYFCENVTLTNIKVINSTGSGVAFVDTVGRVEINDSTFDNNNSHNKYNLSYGIYIKFSSDNGVYKNRGRGCAFVLLNDYFTDNSVSSYHNPKVYTLYKANSNEQFGLGGGLTLQFEDDNSWYTEKVINITNCTFELNTGRHGGGISLNFTKSTSRNNITIKHCDFTNNTGDFGGGLSVIFSNNPYNNHVLMSNIKFSMNYAKMGGGAMELGFHFQKMEHPQTNNTVILRKCTILENRAQYGGGTVLHYSRAKRATQSYIIKFVNCTWERNTALFGSAVEASVHVSDKLTSGQVTSPVFRDCKFISNYRIEEKFVSHDNRFGDDLFRLSWGKGVFFTTGLPILFKGNTVFFGSNTTALCLSSSIVKFAAGSNVNFTSNTGLEGGAINLYGLSEIQVSNNSSFLFYNNTALLKGGAIIYRSGNKLDFVSSRRCFIRYIGNTTIVAERSITIEFRNNSALPGGNREIGYGHTIYATTLIPCRRACTKQEENNDENLAINTDIAFNCIGNVVWNYNGTHEVSTDGAVFSISNESSMMTAIPGKEFELNFKLLDENSEEAYDSYRVAVPSSEQMNIKLDPTYSFIRDKTIKLYGKPGHRAQVVVATNNFRDIAVALEVEMEGCPPGLVTQNNKKGIECVCSASTMSKTYFGILRCELNSYQAYLIRGYWIGYDSENGSESTLQSGYCPRGFCVKKKPNETEILLPMSQSMAALNEIICGKHRQGKLCGSCSRNMSVYYHSNSYHCHPNSKKCKFGFLLYVVSEIMPVTILFMIVLFFNVKFTSGALNGFIFFIQFIDTMLIDANGFISTHDVLDTLMSIYLFMYRMFNLNFFTIDRFSFCLWEGANTLDIFAFKYVTILYSVTLVVITVFLKKFGKGKHLICYRRKNLSESSQTSLKSTMIHGFSAFFVMCYSQCAKVTLFILTPGRIRSLGQLYHNNVTSVVFYHGDLKYLQGAHIKYALSAFLFGIALVVIPPLLLVVYPLCYKVLALLHIEETRYISILCCILPLERMKPMFDSFQSCFKDKYRFFAGLYFLYRLVALLSFLIADSLTKFYIALEVQLIVMLTLQAITYPYRKRWHNIIDVLLFANLAVINAMTMFNYHKSKERYTDTRSINAVSAIQTILVSTPFICMVCFIVLQLVLRIKSARKRNQERSRDELTDTLSLVDYRQLEDSKSL